MSVTYFREALLESSAVDLDKGQARLSFSSELPVLRTNEDGDQYWEVLSHAPGDCNLGLLNRSGVVLLNHSADSQIGSVVPGSVKIDSDRKARATIELDPGWWPYLRDIRSGKAPNQVSVGYSRLSVVGKDAPIDGVPVLRFSFAPHEVSILTEDRQPADHRVGFGRSKPMETENQNQDQNERPLNSQERREMTRASERRSRNINTAVDEIAPNHPHLADRMRQMASEAILQGATPEAFNRSLLSEIQSNPRPREYVPVGVSAREAGQFSITGAIRDYIKHGHPTGLAAEMSNAFARQIGQEPEGFFIPPDISFDQIGKRDLNVTTASQGGNFVPTLLQPTVIELLRNRMVCQRLGVMSLMGLSGFVAIPRQTSSSTAYSVAETATLTASNQTIDQAVLTPRRIGAYNDYSKQLLLQSSVDVENFMRNDLIQTIAIKWDHLMLEGSGSNSEPTGILHSSGIGSVTFGAAPTWDKVVSFETALATANADIGPMAYVVGPAVKAKWKTTAKIGSTFPIYLWEDGEYNDGSNDGKVNLCRAACTNQITGNAVFFGRWSDAIHAMWGGLDVVIDQFTLARNAQIRIVINTFGDFVVRHAASFAVSSDSGAQ